MTLSDHVFGRPDPRYRKYQIFTVVALWSAFIYGKPHGPKPISKLSRFFGRRLTVWQIVVLTCMTEYVRRNFARLVGVESPEPLAAMYNRDYFRATWVTTALDAGYWTARRVRGTFFREVASVLCTFYYLVCAEQADQMVRKVRGKLSLEHLRVSWNKGTTPFLAWVGRRMRPRHLRIRYKPRQIRIPRPKASPNQEPIHAWLYFDGPVQDLREQDKVILDIPGGGFIAMDPRCHDDKLIAWAAKTGFPVVSLDYKKAPEYPYPYALNECYDAYYSIVSSRGVCVGLPGDSTPKIVLSGDSAGGNLAAGLVLTILQARSGPSEVLNDLRNGCTLPLPEAVVLIYPALDVNITSWLTDEQSALIKDPAMREANQGVLRRKTEDYSTLTNTPIPSDNTDEEEGLRMTPLRRNKTSSAFKDDPIQQSPSRNEHDGPEPSTPAADISVIDFETRRISISQPQPLRTRLEMSSMISYFNDRVLSPEMLRAMVLLYVGPHNRPDFSTNFLLSPLRAPEELLRDFPKVYMLTGERDPLNDDTTIFAGRLRQAHLHKFQTRQELGLIPSSEEFDHTKHVYTELIPGVSHGFLQFASVYKPAWTYIEKCSRWMKSAFDEAAKREARGVIPNGNAQGYFDLGPVPSMHRSHRSSQGTESSDNEERPLMMSSLSLITSAEHNSQGGLSLGIGTDRSNVSGRGGIKKPAFSGRRSPVMMRKNQSLQKLTDSAVLMDRRMHGVTGGLMGDERTPETP